MWSTSVYGFKTIEGYGKGTNKIKFDARVTVIVTSTSISSKATLTSKNNDNVYGASVSFVPLTDGWAWNNDRLESTESKNL